MHFTINCGRETLRETPRRLENNRLLIWLISILSWCQDQAIRLPGPHETVPSETTGQGFSHISALDPIVPQANGLFQNLEFRILCYIGDQDHFIVVRSLPEPGGWPFGYHRFFALRSNQSRKVSRLGQDTVQTSSDNHTRDELLALPLWGPVGLTTPAKETVIGLSHDASCPHLFCKLMGRSEHKGISGAKQLNR